MDKRKSEYNVDTPQAHFVILAKGYNDFFGELTAQN